MKNNVRRMITAVALNTNILTTRGTWCLDNGGTMDMFNEKSKFEVHNGETKSKVYTATEKRVNVLGEGNIRIKVQSQSKFGNNIKEVI